MEFTLNEIFITEMSQFDRVYENNSFNTIILNEEKKQLSYDVISYLFLV